jgi:hypothetical protein
MSIIITCPDLYKAMALILHKIHKHEDKQINVYLQKKKKKCEQEIVKKYFFRFQYLKERTERETSN